MAQTPDILMVEEGSQYFREAIIFLIRKLRRCPTSQVQKASYDQFSMVDRARGRARGP